MSVDRPIAVAVDAGRRQVLTRRIRLLVTATISYNVIEAAVALTAGAQASSTALIGFGLDSVIEVSSAAAVAWQFSKPDHEAREKAALRVIAMSFFALAAYVSVECVRALFGYLLCTYLSAVLLVGLGLNSLFGWSWADPIAGLVIAAVAVREGREAWAGRNCCGPTPLADTTCGSTQCCD